MSDYQVMPPLSDEERAALRTDIAERGVLVPIVTDQHGNILDGHHRKEIADELGMSYRTDVVEVSDDDDACSIARMYNLARRHLTQEQKRQLIAQEIRARPSRSDREIARMMRCDHKTVGSVRRELSGEIPQPCLSAAQRQMARVMFAAMRARVLQARAVLGAEGRGMFDLHDPGIFDGVDPAVIGTASQHFAEWACNAPEVRGFMWEFADPDDRDAADAGVDVDAIRSGWRHLQVVAVTR